MPNALKIKKTMQKQGIPKETISRFEYPDPKGNRPEPMIAFINQMDEYLTPGQCLSVMEEQGCCKTGISDAANRAFGNEHAGKPLKEKVRLLAKADIPYKVQHKLNSDNTLSVYWGAGKPGDYKCVCSSIKKLTNPQNISHTWCGCCGGHAKHHLQNALSVKLQLKEVVSSPISSGGRERCEFIFDILKEAEN